MRTSVLHAALVVTVLAVALGVWAACKGPDNPDDVIVNYGAVAAGNNVTVHVNPNDTAARAVVAVNRAGSDTGYDWQYVLAVAPVKAVVTKINLMQGTGTATVKATLCAAAPCASTGHIKLATADTAFFRTMRNVGSSIRVYTDSESGAAGSMMGALAPVN